MVEEETTVSERLLEKAVKKGVVMDDYEGSFRQEGQQAYNAWLKQMLIMALVIFGVLIVAIWVIPLAMCHGLQIHSKVMTQAKIAATVIGVLGIVLGFWSICSERK
ncbi:MAG: hypothetical protein ABIH38_01215 [Patescibacteria group bacterium]